MAVLHKIFNFINQNINLKRYLVNNYYKSGHYFLKHKQNKYVLARPTIWMARTPFLNVDTVCIRDKGEEREKKNNFKYQKNAKEICSTSTEHWLNDICLHPLYCWCSPSRRLHISLSIYFIFTIENSTNSTKYLLYIQPYILVRLVISKFFMLYSKYVDEFRMDENF